MTEISPVEETRRRGLMTVEIDGATEEIAGMPGEWGTVEVDELRIDSSYQRPVTAQGLRNIQHIARYFDWRRFSPLIGVLNDDGTVSVIDGQHRATAAKARGITRLPVYLVKCSSEQAAAAFAAINGQITSVKTQDVFKAKVSAGEPGALALKKILDAAEVTIVPNKAIYRKGETASLSSLERALDRYGAELLILTLQCITQTGDGNPGLITGPMINGIARALLHKVDLLEQPSKLFECFDQMDLRDIMEAAMDEQRRTRAAAQSVICRLINDAIHQLITIPALLKRASAA
jgi:hypothetical protein